MEKGGLALPLFPAAVYGFETMAAEHEAFSGGSDAYIYARYRHPTGEAVERHLAILEDAEAALLCASGMAALHLVVAACCRSGDHILATPELYGGTTELLRSLDASSGIAVELVPLDAISAMGERVRDRTRLILVESPSNPLSRLVDFEAMFSGLPTAKRPVTAVDGTLATPLGQKALAAGFDLVIHSATKYLGGHDDLTAGVVAGNRDLVGTVGEQRRMLGANIDPQTAWLLDRGLKTLALRWERQCSNALYLAERLEGHPRVGRVHYLGLPSHPHHELATRQMQTSGALIAFELQGTAADVDRVLDRLRLIARAPSLGGVESMTLHPATASHRSLTADEQIMAGISDGLIRVSAGIEEPEDLWGDLAQALE